MNDSKQYRCVTLKGSEETLNILKSELQKRTTYLLPQENGSVIPVNDLTNEQLEYLINKLQNAMTMATMYHEALSGYGDE